MAKLSKTFQLKNNYSIPTFQTFVNCENVLVYTDVRIILLNALTSANFLSVFWVKSKIQMLKSVKPYQVQKVLMKKVYVRTYGCLRQSCLKR